MIIKHNISAMNSQRNLKLNQNKTAGNVEKLSSGYKINRSADDAAGLAISEKMRCTITGLEQGTENAEDGIGLVRTAEGALDEIHAMLNRLKELSVQSANGTYDDGVDRNAIQKEVDAVITEVDRIVETTNFNGIPLLNRDDMTDVLKDILAGELIPVLDYYEYGDLDSSGIYTGYTELSIGDSDAWSPEYSSGYYSDYIAVPDWAESIPGDVDLPYTLEMKVTCYDDDSPEGNAQFSVKTVSLTISEDAGGNISVIGSNGVNYASSSYKYHTDLDNSDPDKYDPVEYVSTDFKSDGITSKQLQYIMAGLVNNNLSGTDPDSSELSMCGTFAGAWYDTVRTGSYSSTGSSTNLPLVSTYNYTTDNATNVKYVRTYNGTNYTHQYTFTGDDVDPDYKGVTYSSVSSSSSGTGTNVPDALWSGNFSSEEIYGISGNPYGDTMYAYGSSDSSFCVIGVEYTATSSAGTQTAQEPDGFDSDDWNSSSNMRDLTPADVIGVRYDPILTHSEGEIPYPIPTGADVYAMTESQLKNNVITIKQMLTDANDNTKDVEIEKKYAIVFKPFVDTVPSYFGEGVEIIYADPDEEEHYAIDELCARMESDPDLDLDFVTRKQDNEDDMSVDANVTEKYTIQMATFSQTREIYEEDEVYRYEEGDPIYVYEQKYDPIILQVGDQNEEFDRVTILIKNMRYDVETLRGVDASTQTAAAKSIDIINDTINSVSLVRSDLGAYDNRLQHTINKNRLTTENLQEAESTIRDADMAEEMMEYTKNNILIQSAQSMLSHAISQPEGVLQLLG